MRATPRGHQISLPVTEKEGYSVCHPASALRWGVAEMQGWRPSMEDAHVAIGSLSESGGCWADTSLFAVFDGHGGQEVAKFSAEHLPQAIPRGQATDAVAALHSSFLVLDEMLVSLGERMQPKDQGHPDNVGCTAVACLIDGTSIVVANTGDSRAVLSRDGRAVELSSDHKPNSAKEAARITEGGGWVTEDHFQDQMGKRTISRVNGVLSVSRAMGDLQFKKNKDVGAEKQIVSCVPDIESCKRQLGDEFLIIACDGVWDVLDSQEVVNRVQPHLGAIRSGVLDPTEVIHKIFDECLATHPSQSLGTDNMTMILVVFDQGQVMPATERRGCVERIGSLNQVPKSQSALQLEPATKRRDFSELLKGLQASVRCPTGCGTQRIPTVGQPHHRTKAPKAGGAHNVVESPEVGPVLLGRTGGPVLLSSKGGPVLLGNTMPQPTLYAPKVHYQGAFYVGGLDRGRLH